LLAEAGGTESENKGVEGDNLGTEGSGGVAGQQKQ
jgi:hypothetical protein